MIIKVQKVLIYQFVDRIVINGERELNGNVECDQSHRHQEQRYVGLLVPEDAVKQE